MVTTLHNLYFGSEVPLGLSMLGTILCALYKHYHDKYDVEICA